jgi:hypothetical protein
VGQGDPQLVGQLLVVSLVDVVKETAAGHLDLKRKDAFPVQISKLYAP